MKATGRMYKGEKTYLALYHHDADITRATPPSLEGNAQRAAHVVYSFGGKTQSLDVFVLSHIPDSIPEARIIGAIKNSREDISTTDIINDIQYDLVKGTSPEVIGLARTDIHAYCGNNPAKAPNGSRVSWHETWIPKTKANWKEPSQYLSGGKQEFTPACGLDANIDVSDGCISGWIPGPNASFDGETFVDFYSSPPHECPQCYAEAKHRGFAKTLWRIQKDKLREELMGNCRLSTGMPDIYGKPIPVLRIGKRTEAGSKFTLDTLALVIETCAETKTKIVMPTQFLEFNPEIARLAKAANMAILYTQNWDEFARGAVAHGCTNEWRREQAVKYHEAGVNALFYINLHPYFPPGEREKGIIELARKTGMPHVQILPVRFYKPGIMEMMTGLNPRYVREPTKEMYGPGEYARSYCLEGKIHVPQEIHPEWQRLISENRGFVRMCHHNSSLTWCGGCGICEGFVIPKQPTPPRRKLKRRYKIKRVVGQRKLEFK